MKRLIVLAIALSCAACSKAKEREAEALAVVDLALTPPPRMAPPGTMVDEAADAAAADLAPAPVVPVPPSGTAPRIAVGPPMLAYSYSYELTLPHRRVDALRRRHEQACLHAGYRVCQVVSTSIRDTGDGEVAGALELRAAPGWMKGFREGLAGDAKGAGGRVEASDVSSEDLSREIVDTSAQLRAKLTLRDRLQALLAGRPGRLSDLLSVERELARVQGEIDSAQSQLTVMQARVAMSAVTVAYASNDVVGPAVRSPLGVAFGGFLGTAAESLAGMVRLVAASLPWALLLGALVWLFRKRLTTLRRPLMRKRTAES